VRSVRHAQATSDTRDGSLGSRVIVERLVLAAPCDPYLDLRRLAEYTCLSRRTLQGFINELPPDQALPCYRLEGKVLVRRSVADAWLQQFRSRGRPSLARALEELGLSRRSAAS